MRALSLVAVVTAAALLAGCQTLGGKARPAQPPAPAAQQSPLVAFVAAAQPGQSATVVDPVLGTVFVTVERQYNAASGQVCRRFNIRPHAGGAAESLVMCQEATGWSIVRLPVMQ